MGTYIVIDTDGSITKVPGGKKFDIKRCYELIGCRTVEITPVQYEGRKRDLWLDEEGMLKEEIKWNRTIRGLSQDYWIKQGVPPSSIQSFAGKGVIWMSK